MFVGALKSAPFAFWAVPQGLKPPDSCCPLTQDWKACSTHVSLHRSSAHWRRGICGLSRC
jgi:hypothetical protein